MQMVSRSFRIKKEDWEAFRKKYGKKAFARLRELILKDLEE